jgi:hypothetical protein
MRKSLKRNLGNYLASKERPKKGFLNRDRIGMREAKERFSEFVDHQAIKTHLADFEREGRVLVEGVSKEGEYRHSINGKASILEPLKALAFKKIRLCRVLVNYGKLFFTREREEIEATLGMHTNEERRNRFLEVNAARINKEVARAKKGLLKIGKLERQKEEARNRKEDSQALLKKRSKRSMDGNREERSDVLGKLYWPLSGTILGVETILNNGALDSLQSDLISWTIPILSLTISLIIGLCAHFVGALLYEKSHKGLISTLAISGGIILGMVLYIRSEGYASNWILVLINVAAALLIGALSFMRGKNSDYHEAEAAYTKWSNREAQLEAKIQRIRQDTDAQIAFVYDQWNARATEAIEDETTPFKERIIEIQQLEKGFDDYLKTHVTEPITAIYQELLVKASVDFTIARKKNNIIEEGMEDFLDDLTELEEEEVDTPDVEEADNPPPVRNDHSVINGNGLNGIDKGFYLLAFLFWSLTACNMEPVQDAEVLIVGDQTIEVADSSALPSTHEVLDFALSEINFPDNPLDIYEGEIVVHFGKIGETSFSKQSSVKLEKAASSISRVKTERRNEQQQFVYDMHKSIEEYTRPEGLDQSYVVDCLCNSLVPLSKSEASIRFAFILSDIIEHSEVEDFYSNPERLQKDYDKVVGTIEGRCPAFKDMDLSGIILLAVYLPDVRRDKVMRMTRDFWSRYFQSKGGEIRWMPNLPTAKVARY